MVGVLQIMIAVFKLGDLTRYISESVILGFMAGAGVLVAIGQIGNFLGVSIRAVANTRCSCDYGKHSPKVAHSIPTPSVLAWVHIVALLLRIVISKYKLPKWRCWWR